MGRREWVVLLLILLVAAVPRLARPDLTEFKADEARLLTLALRMSDGEFALRGISSSVGFPNAPISVWLYSLPLFAWPHPYAATLFTGALGVLAVGGIYWLARRYTGPTAAVVAALMLAVSPWAIVFGRKIWAQNLLPAVAVAWGISAALAFVDRRRPFVALHLLSLAVAAQIHPAAAGLAPATLFFLIVFHRRVDWRYVALGGALAILTAGPFLWYLWGRWQAEGELPLSGGQGTAAVSLDSLRLILELAAGAGLRPLAGAGYDGWPGETIARLLWVGFILVATIWAAGWTLRRRNEREADYLLICLAWFLSPAILFIWPWTRIYVHYFIAALPAPYLLAAAFFGRMADRSRPGLRAMAWAALLGMAALQLASWAGLMAAVGRDPMAGGFGMPLGVKLAAAEDARQLLAESGATEILLVGDGTNPEQEAFPAEFRALLHRLPLRYVHLNREAVFPAATAVVLLDRPAADGVTSVRELYQQQVGGLEIGDWKISQAGYAVGLLPGGAAPPPDVALVEPALLANFVRLLGHDAPRVGAGGVLWDIHWRPADNPDPADYHWFNHLIDGAGNRIAQSDAAAFPAAQWRPGDVVISRFHLASNGDPRPSPAMRVGMYRFPSLENVPVLDEAANPAADAVLFPLPVND